MIPKKHAFFWLIILCASCLLLAEETVAGVDLRTGHYQWQEHDITVGENVILQRYYDSSTTAYIGWFGRGWGSSFETHLTILPDGTALLQQHGNGKKTWFQPSTNTDWLADSCPCEQIKAATRGYRHSVHGKAKEDFDSHGRLVRQWNDNGTVISLHYSPKRIHIDDGQGHWLDLLRGESAWVQRTASNDTQHSRYVYGQRGLLLYAVDASGEGSNYWYGESTRLIGVHMPVESLEESIEYNPTTGKVHTVEMLDGLPRYYRYQSKEHDGVHEGITEVWEGGIRLQRSAFWLKTLPNGRKWLSRKVEDGTRWHRDTRLNPSGMPLRIESGDGAVTSFRYDPINGHLLEKITAEQTIAIHYNGQHHKISRIDRQWHETGKQSWTAFRYNQQGDLTFAENSNGDAVALQYGTSTLNQGRIIKISEGDAVLYMDYNSIGKPAHIRADGLGEITIDYDDNGELADVHTDSNEHMVALQVMQIFQRLIAIVKPSDIDFSM